MTDADMGPLDGQSELPPLDTIQAGLGGLSFQAGIQKVADTGRPQSFCILGVPKVGKTTLAATSYDIPALRAAGKKVLILAAEKGTTSIAKHFPDVEVVFIPNHPALLEVINELLTKPHDYGVLILDTLDRMQEKAVDYLLAIGASNTQKAWGDVKAWTLGLVQQLHESPMFSIFLVHTKEEKDERTGKWKLQYALQGSATDKIGQEFDLIGHMAIRTGPDGKAIRTLQVAPTEGGITGSRWEQELPALIENPTIPMMFEYINGTRTKTDTTIATTSTTTKEN